MKNYLPLFCCLFFANVLAQAQNNDSQQLQNLIAKTNAKITYHKTTNLPNFIRIPKDKALTLKGATLTEKTSHFLDDYAEIFKSKKWSQELFFTEEKTDDIGFSHLKMTQEFYGVPIFDGQLNFHFNTQQQLVNISGNFLSNIRLNPNPSLSKVKAGEIALKTVNDKYKDGFDAPLKVHQATLYVFNNGMIKGEKGQNFLAYQLEVRNDANIREYLYIDAHTGDIIEQYSGMCSALHRALYEENTSNLTWEEGDALPGALNQDQQNQVIVAEQVYYLFRN